MEESVKGIEMKCRLCAVDSQNTTFDIFGTGGLQEKIRKYLQITVKREDYLPKIVCPECFRVLGEFDRLCTMARNTQKQFLVMLTENNNNNKDKAGAKSPPSNSKSVGPKKTRRRRKKKEVIPEIIPPVLSHPFPSMAATPDSWGNFKLGQIIRDTELIKLILKALKWTNNDENVERLRNTDLAAVLTNSDLLHDDDLIRLIKSYISGCDGNNNSSSSAWNWNDGDADSVTKMEVKVDPSLFFFPEEEEDEGEEDPEMETDDSRTISVDLNELMAYIEEEGQALDEENDELLALHSPFQCTSCPERFVTHVQLQDHVLTHLIRRNPSGVLLKGSKKEKKTGKTGKKRSKKDTDLLNKAEKEKQKDKEKENDPTKVCQYCQKKFKRRQDLRFHINQHTGERPYKCVSCPKAFASSGNCLTHRKRMHPELFQNKKK